MVFDGFAFCRVNKIPLSIIMKLNNHLLAFWQVIYPFIDNRYSGCCWISLADGRDPSWEVRVKGNLTRESDDGLINSSPTSRMPLVVRVQHGCNHTIEIPGRAEVTVA